MDYRKNASRLVFDLSLRLGKSYKNIYVPYTVSAESLIIRSHPYP